MPESTLSLGYFDFIGETAEWLGYRRGADNGDPTWSTQQSNNVLKAVAAGQRQFYRPPPLEGEQHSHEWSFMKPVGHVTIVSGDDEIVLPDDFGGFDGPIVVTVSGSTTTRTLDLMGSNLVRQKQAEAPDTSGIPQMVALLPIKEVGVNEGQRMKLSIWPKADAAYRFEFPYTILPEAISGARPYCLGGAQHVETVLASCLERAEFYKDNARGVCYANWMTQLAASVSADRRMRPVVVGMNRDRGSSSDYGTDTNYWQTVTYRGLEAEDV